VKGVPQVDALVKWVNDVMTDAWIERRRLETFSTLAEVEQRHVLAAVKHCGGEISDAAKVLGIGRTTLYRKLKGLK